MAVRFKQGDKVRFLNEVGGGVVTRVDANGAVFVETPDGFEIPVAAKDLVGAQGFSVDDENVAPVAESKPEAKKTGSVKSTVGTVAPKIPVVTGDDLPTRILLGFIPENQGPVFNSPVGCYLINDSPFFAYYTVGSFERGNYYHVADGLIESDTKNLLKVFEPASLARITGFHVQVIWFSAGRYKRRVPVDQLVDVHMVNFSKDSYYRNNEFFEEKAVLFTVAGKEEPLKPDDIEVPQKVIEQKTGADVTRNDSVRKKEPVSDTLEIDLHLDEIAPGANQFTQQSFLALQMSRFRAALDEALSKKMRRLVVIHGVGQGTLKMEIRKELQEKYPSFPFQDASFREYGFGATMVYLNTDKKQ
jgi:hypothetical protein